MEATFKRKGEGGFMTSETLVAMFDSPAEAQNAVRDLESAGISRNEISVGSDASALSSSTASTGSSAASPAHSTTGGLFDWLFGESGPREDAEVYRSGLSRGGTIVSVRVYSSDAERIAAILEHNGAIDVDERRSSLAGGTQDPSRTAAGTSTAPYPGAAPTQAARSGDEVVQLSEEQLKVGKRDVAGGAVRVRRYVVETPVQEQVTLREEHVSVERRPATGEVPVSGDAFKEREFTVEERREEPVVSKEAHITEEVVVHKDATERVETVKDTVRRTEVEVDESTRAVDRAAAGQKPSTGPNTTGPDRKP
jgi:uncharacterized protein (TIGR02271 family)